MYSYRHKLWLKYSAGSSSKVVIDELSANSIVFSAINTSAAIWGTKAVNMVNAATNPKDIFAFGLYAIQWIQNENQVS